MRWQQVKDLVQGALDRATDTRAAFLDHACADDQDLRREVESLLAAHEQAGEFLSRPAAFDAGPTEELDVPAAGRHIGPYLVLDAIAHGGMSSVFRAVRNDDVFQKTVA